MMVRVGGVVLCGGQSQRMGRPKATLAFGAETMLERVLRLLREVVEPLVVVASPGQELPALSDTILLAHDRCQGRGPLEGLYNGLTALHEHVEAAYVTACDVPLLQTDFVRYLIHQLNGHDVSVPVEGEFYHPLAAVYRTNTRLAIAEQLADDQLRMTSFYRLVKVRRVPVQQLRTVDPDLQSLMNVNSPADYEAALRRAGLRVD